MRKMSLALDQLAVESFETVERDGERGTVVAFQSTGGQADCHCTWGVGTCDHTCEHSCACGGSGNCSGTCTHGYTCPTGGQADCEC